LSASFKKQICGENLQNFQKINKIKKYTAKGGLLLGVVEVNEFGEKLQLFRLLIIYISFNLLKKLKRKIC